MDVLIVDYGLGNLWSVKSAFEYVGVDVTISSDPIAILQSRCLVLPGVGSFGVGMKNLHSRGLVNALNVAVRDKGTPILGICLGMQLLADASEEAPGVTGLGWIPGRVLRFQGNNLRLPHMGFNAAIPVRSADSFRIAESGADFYFVHSYCFAPEDEADVLYRTTYGNSFVSGIRKNNIVGVQFHPEKSQHNGLRLICDFVKFSAGPGTHG